MNLCQILNPIPNGLREELIDEYNRICQHYLERRWMPTEVGGGRFAEIVYTIIHGKATGAYPSNASKPSNMVDACKDLEKQTTLSRGFRILIPRALPLLYEIRNNRDAGHVGGEVDSNGMDSTATIAICSWIMGEMIREFHQTSVEDAQKIVDYITSRKVPVIWEQATLKRVLKPKLSLALRILLLLSTSASPVPIQQLITWLDTDTKKYVLSQIRQLHKEREVEFDETNKTVQILPPGTSKVEAYLGKFV